VAVRSQFQGDDTPHTPGGAGDQGDGA